MTHNCGLVSTRKRSLPLDLAWLTVFRAFFVTSVILFAVQVLLFTCFFADVTFVVRVRPGVTLLDATMAAF